MAEAEPQTRPELTELEQVAKEMAEAISADLEGEDWRFGGICLVAEVLFPGDTEDEMNLHVRTRFRGTPAYAVGLLDTARRKLSKDLDDG